jgi:hypothetical protein
MTPEVPRADTGPPAALGAGNANTVVAAGAGGADGVRGSRSGHALPRASENVEDGRAAGGLTPSSTWNSRRPEPPSVIPPRPRLAGSLAVERGGRGRDFQGARSLATSSVLEGRNWVGGSVGRRCGRVYQVDR